MWARLAVFAMFFVLAAVAAVGLQYLARTTPVREVRRLGGGRLIAGDARFCETVRILTNTTLTAGNRIRLLLNGDETFERLFDAVAAAREIVTWQAFWYRPGLLADEVSRLLTDRARNGVKVLFLRDVFGSAVDDDYLDGLRSAGVEVATFRPWRIGSLYKFQQRTHVRSVVVDGRVGFTGGFGIDDRWRGDGRHADQWRDTSIMVEGPVVDQLQASFISNWAEATGQLLVGDPLFEARAQPADDDTALAGVLYGVPTVGSTNAERFFTLSIAGASERLFITSAYFVPVRQFRRLLCSAAERGVDVRVLTAGRNTDQPSTWYAVRAHYAELLRSGVRLYEYMPTMLHAKTLVVDGVWCAVGSLNFDNRSIALNDEVALVARDPRLGACLERVFRDDLEYADEVEIETFEKRGRLGRLREQAAARVSRWL